MDQFDRERLDVYKLSLQFVAHAHDIAQLNPPGFADVSEQLRRASRSITLNIAEGAGEFSKREKVRFYRMGKRSATECAGALDIFLVLKLLDEKRAQDGKAILVRIVSMLVRLIHTLGSPGRGTDTGSGTGKAIGGAG
jgi:four helix bundle protein